MTATTHLAVCTALRNQIAESCASARDLTKAFVASLLEGFDQPDVGSIAARAANWVGADQHFQIVATLGFAADAGGLSEQQLAALKNGLRRLSGFSHMVNGLPTPFCADAVGILGIALGTAFMANAEVMGQLVQWATPVLRRMYRREGTEDCHRCLFAAADRKLGAPLNLAVPNSAAVVDVRLALLAKGVITYPDTQVEQDVARVRQSRIEEPLGGPVDCERAALCVAGVEWVNRQPDNQADPAGASTEHISTNPPQTLKDDQQGQSGKMSRLHEAQQPQASPKVKKPVRRTRQYEQIDKALRDFSAAHPKTMKRFSDSSMTGKSDS